MNTDLLMASTSSRMSEPFPAGLRVLVVDHDTTCKRLEKMLIKSEFNYQVTTCNLGREALDLIEKAEDGFDILMSTDANLTDMDGLMFVDQVVRLKRKLSIILMSVDGDKSGYRSKTIEGLRRGAYYILKPIESKDVGNLWMHVFMQRCCKYSKSIEAKESLQQAGDDDRNHEAGGESQALAPIQIENNNVDDGEAVARRKKNNNDLLVPKTRVSWNDDLHHKFLQALQQVGLNAGPKKILELMKVRGLTRDNVASHLQKFKQNLERQRKEAAKAYNNLVLSNSDNISLLQDGVTQNGMNPDSITAQFSSQNPYDQHWRHHVEEDDGYLRDTNPLNSNPEDPVNLYLNDDAQSPTSDTHNNGYLSNGNNI